MALSSGSPAERDPEVIWAMVAAARRQAPMTMAMSAPPLGRPGEAVELPQPETDQEEAGEHEARLEGRPELGDFTAHAV